MRLAVVGKGGAGKSVLAGTLARVVARRGHRVLALDSDMQPGLALSLGARVPDEPPLMAAAERGEDRRWRLVRGVGPVRAIQRFATPAPDGVRLLQAGKPGEAGTPAIMPALQAFWQVIHHLDGPASLRDWWVIGDLPAGPRQVAFDWAPYAERFLLVTEPTTQSVLAARRVARLARLRGGELELVVSKARGSQGVARVERDLGLRAIAVVPVDDAVREAERAGVALLEAAPSCAAVGAIEALATALGAGSVTP